MFIPLYQVSIWYIILDYARFCRKLPFLLLILPSIIKFMSSFTTSFIHLSSSKRRLDYHAPPTTSLSTTMRKRRFCHAHTTWSDLELYSKRKVDYHGPPAVSLQCRCGSACSVTLTPPCQTRRHSLQALIAISGSGAQFCQLVLGAQF